MYLEINKLNYFCQYIGIKYLTDISTCYIFLVYMAGKKISFNQLLKLRFADGEEMCITIIDPKSKENYPGKLVNDQKIRYWCSADSPLGRSLLGHEQGETIEYQVSDHKLQVTILQVAD